SSAPDGVADFSGGTIDALVGTMYVGRAPDGANTGSANCSGTLTFDSGVLNINTLIAGFQPRAIGDAGAGVINVNSHATLGSGASLVVSSLTLGSAAGGAGALNTSGTLNITKGTVMAGSIFPGTNSVSTIGLNDGQLSVTSPVGNATGPLGTL